MLKQELEFEVYEQKLWQAEDDIQYALEGFLSKSQKAFEKAEKRFDMIRLKAESLQEKTDLLIEACEMSMTKAMKKKLTTAQKASQAVLQEMDVLREEYQFACDELEYYTIFMEYVTRRAKLLEDFDQAWHAEQEEKNAQAQLTSVGSGETVVIGSDMMKLNTSARALSKQVELRIRKTPTLASQPMIKQTWVETQDLKDALKD